MWRLRMHTCLSQCWHVPAVGHCDINFNFFCNFTRLYGTCTLTVRATNIGNGEFFCKFEVFRSTLKLCFQREACSLLLSKSSTFCCSESALVCTRALRSRRIQLHPHSAILPFAFCACLPACRLPALLCARAGTRLCVRVALLKDRRSSSSRGSRGLWCPG